MSVAKKKKVNIQIQEWEPAKPVVLNPYEKGKINYTEEENYEAYKVFCIMDVDNSGCITIRELQRLLMGQFTKFMHLDFPHPDTGIIWGLDHENCVVIKDIEPLSPASKRLDILVGMRLKQVNSEPLPKGNKVGLKILHKELIRTGHGPVHFEFYEPFYLITKFTTHLDLEVDGIVYSVALPIGAANDLALFARSIQSAMEKVHPLLGRIKVLIDPKSRQVTFLCEDYPFRLLFATGPKYQTSCRYTLGFWSEDFPYAHEHHGQMLSIDLKLRLTEEEMDILLSELFNLFDTDGSGEFRFEEFRNFYIQFLSSEEKLLNIKNYAAYRFRDLEEEARMLSIIAQRKARADRRANLKIKNASLITIHFKKFKDNCRVGEDGIPRRTYAGKREDHVMVRRKKRGKNKITEYGANKFEIETATRATAEEVSLAKQRTKEIRKKQEVARKLKMHAAYEDDDARKAEHKKAIVQARRRYNVLHMGEVVETMRECLDAARGGDQVAAIQDITGFSFNYEKRIHSPALHFGGSGFGVPDVDDIEMKDVSVTEMHPAGISYFFIKKVPGRDYDSNRVHPTFFGADFERETSKASLVALGAARTMMKDLNADVKLKKSAKASKTAKQLAFAARHGTKSLDTVENTAIEVVTSVMSWGVTLVVLSVLRDREIQSSMATSALLAASSEVPGGIGQSVGGLGAVADPLALIAKVGEAGGMGEINRLFDQIAADKKDQREREETEAAQKAQRRRAGRFGPDEIFDEVSENSSKYSQSKIKKRTVRAGFWLENELKSPERKRRKGFLDGLNTDNDQNGKND
jgi:hypothetical protein